MTREESIRGRRSRGGRRSRPSLAALSLTFPCQFVFNGRLVDRGGVPSAEIDARVPRNSPPPRKRECGVRKRVKVSTFGNRKSLASVPPMFTSALSLFLPLPSFSLSSAFLSATQDLRCPLTVARSRCARVVAIGAALCGRTRNAEP